ncbi:MAG: creatininase family protein [Symbiobacteriaceae bacterium]|nr:creatininase family protein [Symbiobacteriaceae bacterium]
MYQLENLTWAEAKEAFTKCKTAIIPWGSIEQHGLQLPLGTDWFASEFMIKDLLTRDYPAMVTPPMPVGFADYHSDFPGTLSFSYDTVKQMATEICSKLVSYGITHFLFYNCHGGNAAPLGRVCYDLRKKGFVAGVFMWYELAGKINKEWAALGHADGSESEVVMAHKPGLVDLAKAKRPVHNDFGVLTMPDVGILLYQDMLPIHMTIRVQDFTPSGAMLEPHLHPGADHGQWVEEVDPAKAIPMRKAVNDYILGFLPEFEKIHFEPIVSKFP